MTELRDFYAALVESSDDAIVAKNTDGIVIAWNPAAEKLFGWTSDEMVGGSIRRLLPPDRQQEEDSILARIRAGERVVPFYTKRLHKQGHLLDVSVSVSPVRDASGKVIGASKMARDVGPYLRAQQALRESEERFRLLAENMDQFAWIADPAGEMVWFNPQWYAFTGIAPGEVAADRTMVHHPEYFPRINASWEAALVSGEEWEEMFPLRMASGEYRWFLARARPIRDEGGVITHWFGTGTDITEQREQAEQIRLLLMEVNHRSKNMLTTIQALARRSAPGEAGFIARFEDRVQSLAINQDILVGREWREVPINELLRLQLTFIPDAPGEFRINGPLLSLAPRAAEVIGMAIHELATNSLKYGALSAEHGYVDIGWSHRPDGSGLLLWWRENGGPPVEEPKHHGFGTTLIRDVPRHNLGANVSLHYNVDGVCWELEVDDSVFAHSASAAALA
jgi:PAS domain S-box-containing protein